MSEFVVIAGLSGAGRSQAANVLEDLGWFVIDNLPPALIDKVAELVQTPGSRIERVALVVGSKAEIDEVTEGLASLRATAERVRVLFLEAADEVLIRRYEDTRRRHPLADGDGVAATIAREREVLEPVKAEADVVVDTGMFNVHELRDRLVELFGEESHAAGMATTVMSFGYKHGLPIDVDIVLDCRFLPNPHWVEELRPRTGLDADVRAYVLGQTEASVFLDRLDHLLDLLMPAYVKEGKSYLTIALGCTGGRHRSVAIAEEVAINLRRRGFDPRVQHRDVNK
ncbi:MAG: RNase adapter RapZ [Actinobacteria bacterium]|nr:RNase adapter RapZ [Actinomycetota bacterium]MBI3257780.1 RNase adapter RapZ [Actinomycetota bacterium]